jgi:hypothetical protein
MNTEKNHFILDFDGKILTIRINGKLVVAYPRRDLGKPVREVLFLYMESLIIGPPPDIKESFEDKIVGFQIPSRGPCTICGRQANLLGGLCYDCSQQPA